MILAPALRALRAAPRMTPARPKTKGVPPMHHETGRDPRQNARRIQPLPPGMQRADHDGELMNLEDLRRENEGIPHVDLAHDIHRPPASPQEREALRESANDAQ